MAKNDPPHQAPAAHPHPAPRHEADPNAPPKELTQAEKDADKEPLKPENAEQLLRAGHRLRKKGDDPENWIAMTRHSGEMAISHAATPDAIKAVLSQDLLLAVE